MEFTVDGRTVFAATGGKAFDRKLPGIVFIHGSGMDRTLWTLQSRYFAHHGFAVLAVDLPGHGRSTGPALDSIGASADWVLRLIGAAGLGAASLVGHSMGALIALEAAGRNSTLISAIALLGVGERMPVHKDLLQAAAADDPLAHQLFLGWGYGRRAQSGGNQAPGLWMMGGGLRMLERSPQGVLSRDLVACNAYDGAAEAAVKLRCPVLLLAGSADRMTPVSGAQALARRIPDARLILLDGVGHMMMVERPDRVLDALRGFLPGPRDDQGKLA